MNITANEYIGEIIHEGFTPTHAHYFVLQIVIKPTLEIVNGRKLIISSVRTHTIVIFMNNPLHKYISQCKLDDTQIIIEGAWITHPTGFHYIVHARDNNGKLQPLICNVRDNNGVFTTRPAISNTISLFIYKDDIADIEGIIKKERNKLEQFKTN